MICRLLSVLCLVCLTAAAARADAVDLASGSWGRLDDPELSCEVNPHRISVSADRRRVRFTWDHEILAYNGEWLREGGYDLLGSGPTSLTLALDGESRLTGTGHPVIWILHLREGGRSYCWARADDALARCEGRYIRCPGDIPLS